MRRRDFLIGSASAASIVGLGQAQDAPTMTKLNRIGVMCGFSDLLAETRDWTHPVKPGKLDIMDLPDMLAHRFHIHNVEVQQFHFLSLEPSYYEQFLQRLKKAKSRMTDMPLELDPAGPGAYSGKISPCSPDPEIRAHAIKLTKQWIDRAAMIECPSVMVNQGKFGQNLTPAIDALKELRDYGASKSVAILMEERHRNGIDTLIKVIKESGINANPDIGNFPDENSMERGLRLMYPLAKTVSHVKWRPERFSFAKAIQISKEMHFKGVYSIEDSGKAQMLINKLLKLL